MTKISPGPVTLRKREYYYQKSFFRLFKIRKIKLVLFNDLKICVKLTNS